MAKKSEKHQASALDEVRRHVRVFVDLGRVAGESNDQNRFLDQAVVQVARAVEIDHVKVLKYRRREADLLVTAGFGWKEGVVRSATLEFAQHFGSLCQKLPAEGAHAGEKASHVQRLQKTLEEANIKLESVLSDVMGRGGRAMIQQTASSF